MEVRTPLHHLAADLREYGENDVAQRVFDLGRHEIDRIWEIAGQHARRSDGNARTRMLLAKALSLAAVEVAEGARRALRRAHRRR